MILFLTVERVSRNHPVGPLASLFFCLPSFLMFTQQSCTSKFKRSFICLNASNWSSGLRGVRLIYIFYVTLFVSQGCT